MEEVQDVKISKKKPIFEVGEGLHKYLKLYQRDEKLPIGYKDLLNFTETVPVMDKFGNDTFWETPLYPQYLIDQLYDGLKVIYAKLKASSSSINILIVSSTAALAIRNPFVFVS